MGFGRDLPVHLVLALILAALRLFGFLVFLSDTSFWAVVPALVCIALVFLATPTSRICLVSLATYLASVYFHGWEDFISRFSEGSASYFDILETTIIALLFVRSFWSALEAKRGAHMTTTGSDPEKRQN